MRRLAGSCMLALVIGNMTDTCIWCAKRPGRSLEHIVPEALGCPPAFVLRSGVCEVCNNRNGKLDRALLTPFELITVVKGIPRKRGRMPTVDGLRSLKSGYENGGFALYINRNTYPVVAPDGRSLMGTNKSDPLQNFRYDVFPDGTAEIKFDHELRFDRKSVRGLFKIAIEAIAYFEGLDAARCVSLNAIKHFVMEGGGDFRAVIVLENDSTCVSYIEPCRIGLSGSRIFGVTLLDLGFVCDFDDKFENVREIIIKAEEISISTQVLPNSPRDLWRKNNSHLALD